MIAATTATTEAPTPAGAGPVDGRFRPAAWLIEYAGDEKELYFERRPYGLSQSPLYDQEALDHERNNADISRQQIEDLRSALAELRDRIKSHPAYAALTVDEEIEIGGDTAELSYLARVADDALGA